MTIPVPEHAPGHDDTLEAEYSGLAAKKGRPIKGNEPRTKKITVNITPSMWEALQDIASLDGITFPDVVNYALVAGIEARTDDILALRDLRARKH